MNDLKTFVVDLERRSITVATTRISVDALNEQDARVLARYQEIHSWDWSNERTENVPQRVTRIIKRAPESVQALTPLISPPEDIGHESPKKAQE